MAESLDDGEFWLPPQFLADNDVFLDSKKKSSYDVCDINFMSGKDALGSENEFSKPLFPFEFPYGFGSIGVSSDLSSPVESVVSSTEESDEEDYIAGVTCKMARSTLADDSRGKDTNKGWILSGSPQSTLCGVGIGCGCRQGSSRGSPSKVSPPPATWDLLYAAAGEVARLRMNVEMYGLNNQNRGILGPPRKPSPVSIPAHNEIPLYPEQSFGYQKLQASQFQQLRQQQMMKQQSSVWGGQQTKGAVGFYNQRQTQNPVVHNRGRIPGRATALGLSPSAWPSLQQAQQQQNTGGSAMRALFLGNPGGKSECAGTGVFLPRRTGAPSESRKKSACSTVLVPARVMHALNLNLDNFSGQPRAQSQFQPHLNGNFNPGNDNASRVRNRSGSDPYQKLNVRVQPEINVEMRLPQEWTY